jgi:hypothetical protein
MRTFSVRGRGDETYRLRLSCRIPYAGFQNWTDGREGYGTAPRPPARDYEGAPSPRPADSYGADIRVPALWRCIRCQLRRLARDVVCHACSHSPQSSNLPRYLAAILFHRRKKASIERIADSVGVGAQLPPLPLQLLPCRLLPAQTGPVYCHDLARCYMRPAPEDRPFEQRAFEL